MSNYEHLNKYHVKISGYIASKVWLSLMANEIVEKSIRSLPLGYDLKINPATKIFFKMQFYSGLAFISVLLFCPVLIIFYFFFFVRKKSKANPSTKIIFLRNHLSSKRYEALNKAKIGIFDGFTVAYDDFLNFGPSDDSARHVPLSGYLSTNPYSFINGVFVELRGFLYDYFENSPRKSFQIFFLFLKRIPHFILVKVSLVNLMRLNKVKKIASFEMISRYSSLLNEIATAFGVDDTVGYPHGLEYDIYYPNGVFGNRVFVTSVAAQEALRSKYPHKSFEIDYEILKALFFVPIHFECNKKLVYFTDSRNRDLDYQNINFLKGKVDFIKLHPADKRVPYNLLGVDFIDDFCDSLACGKVIVRASTVVFEAQLSGCEVYCLCTSDREKYLADYLYPTIGSLSVIKVNKLSSFLERI